MRLAITRAVSGLSGDAIQLASTVRRPAGLRAGAAAWGSPGRAGSRHVEEARARPSSPGAWALPRSRTNVSGGRRAVLGHAQRRVAAGFGLLTARSARFFSSRVLVEPLFAEDACAVGARSSLRRRLRRSFGSRPARRRASWWKSRCDLVDRSFAASDAARCSLLSCARTPRWSASSVRIGALVGRAAVAVVVDVLEERERACSSRACGIGSILWSWQRAQSTVRPRNTWPTVATMSSSSS